MNRNVWCWLGMLLVLSLTVPACTIQTSDLPGDLPRISINVPTPQTSAATEDRNAAPASQLLKLPTQGGCQAKGDLEGQFNSSNQMPDYLACIVPVVEEWIDVVYAGMPHPAGYYFVPIGYQAWDGGCDVDAAALMYCRNSERVYFGEASTWELYANYGDASMAAIAAHEATHHFQFKLGMPSSDGPEQIRYENQADCGAGAFMLYSYRRGYMNPTDDIADLANTLKAAGEAEGTDRTHGTVEERVASFKHAYYSRLKQPMYACVAFVPEVPIFFE